MHIHILGIGGTFMSALAILARQLGHEVTGCDMHCYPPVSDLLLEKHIEWTRGYDDCHDALRADLVVVGNVIKRGMPVLEAVLNSAQRMISGPQWIAEAVLSRYRVLAVAGTHGKTTVTSMLAHIFQEAGLEPGFLIGGVAPNLGTNARLGEGKWFVIEADEYDSAFFDKRPKMMHYHPEIAILNNLEFDHADIYSDLDAIQQQFHYYLKTMPSKGIVLKPRDDKALDQVIQRGIFCNLEQFALDGSAHWRADMLNECGSHFDVWHQNKQVAEVQWSLMGRFNVENGLAAMAASYHAGVSAEMAACALASFKPVKRRLEVKLDAHGIIVYDDFAHHPTAIAKTVQALKRSGKHQRVIVVLEFASNTMRSGAHIALMPDALAEADFTFFLKPTQFDLEKHAQNWHSYYEILPVSSMIVKRVVDELRVGDAVVIMSNHGFDNIHQDIIRAINRRFND